MERIFLNDITHPSFFFYPRNAPNQFFIPLKAQNGIKKKKKKKRKEKKKK
jgi:hypothetical protein